MTADRGDATTLATASRRISSDTTLVSRMIEPRLPSSALLRGPNTQLGLQRVIKVPDCQSRHQPTPDAVVAYIASTHDPVVAQHERPARGTMQKGPPGLDARVKAFHTPHAPARRSTCPLTRSGIAGPARSAAGLPRWTSPRQVLSPRCRVRAHRGRRRELPPPGAVRGPGGPPIETAAGRRSDRSVRWRIPRGGARMRRRPKGRRRRHRRDSRESRGSVAGALSCGRFGSATGRRTRPGW